MRAAVPARMWSLCQAAMSVPCLVCLPLFLILWEVSKPGLASWQDLRLTYLPSEKMMVFISQLFTDVCIKGALLSTILGTCEIKEIDLQVEKKNTTTNRAAGKSGFLGRHQKLEQHLDCEKY